jgi:hypothetical protein
VIDSMLFATPLMYFLMAFGVMWDQWPAASSP